MKATAILQDQQVCDLCASAPDTAAPCHLHPTPGYHSSEDGREPDPKGGRCEEAPPPLGSIKPLLCESPSSGLCTPSRVRKRIYEATVW